MATLFTANTKIIFSNMLKFYIISTDQFFIKHYVFKMQRKLYLTSIQNVLLPSELVGKEKFCSKHLYHIVRVILLYHLEGLPMLSIFY